MIKKYVTEMGYANHPVTMVFMVWRQRICKVGQGKRLPTEAEWEYAAGGGNKSKHFKYSGSGPLKMMLHGITKIPDGQTHPIGKKTT